ncbi:hypothetical protein JCM19314_2355 [Nonlabens ulvanivorans]|uniref:Uncharacterized protein n=1 Tax=Nonlabens ulvanivorans TaxID=906888 RepID=A0A090QDI2_NONUL|nr:hypothetical protein JCM19314_2355 [Nonlabens ulvanivorans]
MNTVTCVTQLIINQKTPSIGGFFVDLSLRESDNYKLL